MGVLINAQRLRHELELRGLTGADFARLAKISQASVSHALRGRQVSPRTVKKIAEALTTTKVLPVAEELIASEGESPESLHT